MIFFHKIKIFFTLLTYGVPHKGDCHLPALTVMMGTACRAHTTQIFSAKCQQIVQSFLSLKPLFLLSDGDTNARPALNQTGR
jgi:hypothetical protein